jgi:uncharacterized protein (TIGR03437 family)
VNQAGGRLTLFVSNYSPGVQQNLTVQITDGQAQVFAFQLTARFASDPTKQAGTFISDPNHSHVSCANANGQPTGCHPGDIQYVTNVGDTQSSQGHGQFAVIWTPPGRDVGPVSFYATAVAANNDGTSGGDHVYAVTAQQASAAPCNLSGNPALNTNRAIEDAASFHNTIGSNGLITINGSGFFAPGAPGYLATLGDLENGNWPTELGCVSVLINGVPAPVFYVSSQQINAQAVSFPASQTAAVQVVLNPESQTPIKSPVYVAPGTPIAPAVFTFGPGGTGNAAALNATQGYAFLADTSVVPSGVSAAPGDIIVLYGTGFGDTNPSYGPGQFALQLAPLVNPISVTIGGVTVSGSHDILYAGLAPDPTRKGNAPGLYQVNVRVPSVPDGDQPITVTVGSSSTQGQVTIPIKNR